MTRSYRIAMMRIPAHPHAGRAHDAFGERRVGGFGLKSLIFCRYSARTRTKSVRETLWHRWSSVPPNGTFGGPTNDSCRPSGGAMSLDSGVLAIDQSSAGGSSHLAEASQKT